MLHQSSFSCGHTKLHKITQHSFEILSRITHIRIWFLLNTIKLAYKLWRDVVKLRPFWIVSSILHIEAKPLKPYKIRWAHVQFYIQHYACWWHRMWAINSHESNVQSARTEFTLLWRHNGHDSVSNHQPHGCLLNRSFRCRLKKTSKPRVTGLCTGNSPVTGEFPRTNGQ